MYICLFKRVLSSFGRVGTGGHDPNQIPCPLTRNKKFQNAVAQWKYMSIDHQHHWLDPSSGGTFSLLTAYLFFFTCLFCSTLVTHISYNSSIIILKVPWHSPFLTGGTCNEASGKAFSSLLSKQSPKKKKVPQATNSASTKAPSCSDPCSELQTRLTSYMILVCLSNA